MTTIKEPFVSVIVPVYNVENYIDDCLNSIRQQTYTNFEIIIVEDCSTDNSDTAITPHLTDKRIKVIHHKKNSGLSAARNTGIDAATGEFIMFVDSDDIIDLNLVQVCLQAALESAADIVLLTVKPFQDGDSVQVIPTSNHKASNYKTMSQVDFFKYDYFAWLKFIRAELIHQQDMQFPVGQYYEDWPFHWEIGFVASKIVNVIDGYYHYRQREDSITGSYDLKILHIFSSEKMLADIVEQYSASAQIKKVLANKIYDSVWFVLTLIQDQYLKEAVIKAKEHIKDMRKYHKYESPSLRTRLLLLNLKLPVPLAVIAISAMRMGLKKLSPARREIHN